MPRKNPTTIPIFYDKSGKRWKRTKIGFFLFGVVIIAGLLTITPKILTNSRINGYLGNPGSSVNQITANNTEVPSPDKLAEQMNQRNIPIIGFGTLVRIVKIEETSKGKAAIPVYDNGDAHLVNSRDRANLGNHQYAIERYGDTWGKHIALTFDDGPDPDFTSQLLDLLSKESAPSTFFFIGSNVAEYPELAKRAANEGHTIGNHTLTHPDINFSNLFRASQEINLTQRIIRSATGFQTSYFRPPYIGNDDESLRNAAYSIAVAQHLGYTTAGYDFDSKDWEFNTGHKQVYPDFNGTDIVVLVHDGGGDRTQTISYVQNLIIRAKQNGYGFVGLNQLHPQEPELFSATTASIADNTTRAASSAVYVWPREIIGNLFFTTVGIVIIGTGLNIILASVRTFTYTPKRRRTGYKPTVTVVIPAYNEENVIQRTVKSIQRSYYRDIELVIVDDGSADKTWTVAKSLARKSKRIRAFHQVNSGKSAAINRGLKAAKGEIIISIDADTLFTPHTVSRLVRHFSDVNVGGVAGNVKVGNVKNLLTRWQALDYIVGINIERTAQALLKSVVTVPGACGAWRKQALVEAGGFSSDTLSEDCDVTLTVQKMGYRILQDNSAISYTEAPMTISSLAKQRFRWTFGNIQSFWKHRDLLFRRKYGWLGLLTIPNAIISILLPLLFMPVLFIVSLGNILQGNISIIVTFFAITVALQFIVAAIGIIIARERLAYLLAVPVIRLVYGPLRTYLLYRSVLTVLKGAHVGWNKLQRTNSVAYLSEAEA